MVAGGEPLAVSPSSPDLVLQEHWARAHKLCMGDIRVDDGVLKNLDVDNASAFCQPVRLPQTRESVEMYDDGLVGQEWFTLPISF